MPGKARLAAQAIKYGPVVYALAQKYGPQVVEQMLRHKDPAKQFVADRRARSSGKSRRRALEHAETVIEGQVQPVFHAGQPYWVVFSRDEPVGVHPHTDIEYGELLLNADPGRRMRPDEVRRTLALPLPRAKKKE